MNINQAELQQIFKLADSVDKWSYQSKRELNNNIFDVLRKYNPKASSKDLTLKALTIAYVYIHNQTDGRTSQFNQTKAILAK